MESPKTDKKKKQKKVKSKHGSKEVTEDAPSVERLVADLDAAVTDSKPQGFHPEGNYQTCTADCALDIGKDADLCLLQLPLSWSEDASGEITLPGKDGLGICSEADGTGYHVLQQPQALASQVYVYAEGRTPHPVAVTRHLTLVKSENLTLLPSGQADSPVPTMPTLAGSEKPRPRSAEAVSGDMADGENVKSKKRKKNKDSAEQNDQSTEDGGKEKKKKKKKKDKHKET